MSRFEDKVVVITGGNSGIGLAAAQQFAAEGARLVLFGRNEKTLNEAAATLPERTLTVQGDVSALSDLDRLFEETTAAYGKFDVLFVNAGIVGMGPIVQVDEAAFDQIMDINFKGAYFTIQKALPYMHDGGSIVLNSSINANIGMPGTSIYAASKAALTSLVRTLSAELVERGIRVNAVSPGPIETPIFGRLGMTDEQIQGFAQQIQAQVPLGRFGKAQEIAKAVTFLASDDASFVLGEELIVDGGMSQL